MIERTCDICSTVFTSIRQRVHGYCSKECKNEARKRLAKERLNDSHFREKRLQRNRQYRHNHKHDPKFHADGRKRSLDCYRRKMKKKWALLVKRCKGCNVEFRPKTDQVEFCSRACRWENQKKRNRERANTPEGKARIKAWTKQRRDNNPEIKLRILVSNQVWRALKETGNVKSDSMLRFLPYSIPQLKAHIESFFNNSNGFTWKNHGDTWELDHVIPKSWFHYTSLDSKEFRDCWALSNLMPTPIGFNGEKGNRRVGTINDHGQLVFLAS